MEKKYFGALDAAEAAAAVTDQWQDDGGEIYDKADLLSLFAVMDDEDPLDEDDEEIYYIVSDSGAIGITHDSGETIDWMVIPTHENALPDGPVGLTANFCEKCGAPVAPDSLFCEKCGHKLR